MRAYRLVLWATVCWLCVVVANSSAATTKPFATAIYSYDQAAHNAQDAETSVSRSSVQTVAEAPTYAAQRSSHARFGGFLAAESEASILGRLPEYAGGKTSGILDTGVEQVQLESGYAGPTSGLPRTGNPGMNWRIRSHVEAHAAAVMREQGLDDATLYINRVPCGGASGCEAMLPRMLPSGARLRVVGPNGYDQVFTGRP